MTSDDEFPEKEAQSTEPAESRQYEWEDAERPGIAVIEAVAAATDREPVDLPPLYGYVDVDALNALVAGKSASTGTVEVAFTYDDVRVSVDSDGRIEIRPATANRE